MTAFSPLELAHPRGHAEAVLALGRPVPPSLLGATASGGVPADIVVVGPGRRGSSKDRTADVARRAAASVAPGGFVYVVAPVVERRRLLAALRREGLTRETAFVHLPDARRSRVVVPLLAPALRYAAANVVAARPVRALVDGLLHVPHAAGLVSGLSGRLGVAVQRDDGASLFDWLSAFADAPPAGFGMIVSSWRGFEHGMVVHCFAEGASSPWAVAKVRSAGGGDEGARLAAVGSTARAAGARVARVLASGRIGDSQVLLQSPAPGRALARSLAPRQLAAVRARVAEWLLAWNVATAVRAATLADDLGRTLVDRARLVAPFIDDGGTYAEWVASRCVDVEAAALPLVAAHHDLTAWNVALGDDGSLVIHDWEAAEERALPLGDLFYFLADATAAVTCYRSRLGAVRDCFAPGGRFAADVARIVRRFRDVLGMSRDAAELCFHACWLRHARNELAGGRSGDQGPFLEILRWVAATRPRPA